MNALTNKQKQVLAFCALALVILILSIVRRPGAIIWPELYFEDGSIFYREQLLTHSWSLLFAPYAGGYALPVPRIAALLATWLSPRCAPYVFNGLGILICSASASLFSLKRFRPVLASDGARVALCLLFGLSFDNTEMLTNASNCFWALGLPIFLFAFVPPVPSSRAGRILSALGGGALAYSTPISMLAMPILLLGLLRKRSEQRPWYLGSITGAAIASIVHLSLPQMPIPKPSFAAVLLAGVVSLTDRVLLSSLIGYHNTQNYLGSGFLLLPLVALFGFGVLVSFLLFRGDRSARARCLGAFYILFAGLATSLTTRNLTGGYQQITGPGVLMGGPRYFYLSSCAFAFLAALAIEDISAFNNKVTRFFRTRPRTYDVAIGLSLLALFSVGLCKNFRVKSGTYYPWFAYADRIANWKYNHDSWLANPELPRTVQSLVVPIELPNWHIYLPGNKLLNEDFEESDFRPWAPFGTAAASVSTDSPENGKRCIRIEGLDGGVSNELFFLPSHTPYEVSAYARTEAGSTGTALLWVSDFANEQPSDGPTILKGSEWQKFTVQFMSTSSRKIRIHLMSKLGVVYWDNVKVVRK